MNRHSPFNHPRSAVAGPRLPEGASARESLNHSGDAFGPRPHASHRAVFHRLGLSVSVAIALAGCGKRQFDDAQSEFSIHEQAGSVWLLRDKRTTCEYIIGTAGVATIRADPRGNVTPNCAASRDYHPLPEDRAAQ